jgi:hypothetical protein
LVLVASSGAITGTPTVATIASFRVRVTGADSLSAEKAFSLTINLPPSVAITAPANYQYFTNSSIAVAGTASGGSGIASVTVNGFSASTANAFSNWTATVSGLSVGTNTLTSIALDTAVPANTATSTVAVIYAAGSFDGNGDGLPDVWQIQHFGSVSAANGGPNDDPDGDGQSNQSEYLAGTDPTDSSSALRIETSALTGEGFVLGWSCVPDKTYRVLYADSPGGPWLEDLPGMPMTAGSGQTSLAYTDATVGSVTKRFYRVRLEP